MLSTAAIGSQCLAQQPPDHAAVGWHVSVTRSSRSVQGAPDAVRSPWLVFRHVAGDPGCSLDRTGPLNAIVVQERRQRRLVPQQEAAGRRCLRTPQTCPVLEPCSGAAPRASWLRPAAGTRDFATSHRGLLQEAQTPGCSAKAARSSHSPPVPASPMSAAPHLPDTAKDVHAVPLRDGSLASRNSARALTQSDYRRSRQWARMTARSTPGRPLSGMASGVRSDRIEGTFRKTEHVALVDGMSIA